jgi:hypothetical protein
MATLAQRPTRFSSERMFFMSMAAWMAVTIFVGFAPTYYLSPWLHGVTSRGVSGGAELTPLIHLHGAIFTSWMVLFCAQVGLIASGRAEVHRLLGLLSLALAPAMLIIGYLTATGAARAGSSPPGWDDKAFLLIPLTSLVLFGGLFVAALMNRQRPDYHKRFMLLATIALLLPALARLVRYFDLPLLPVGVLGGLVLLNLYPLTLVAFDLKQRGRVHPATMWGAALFFLAWPGRLVLGSSAAWQHLARALVS